MIHRDFSYEAIVGRTLLGTSARRIILTLKDLERKHQIYSIEQSDMRMDMIVNSATV